MLLRQSLSFGRSNGPRKLLRAPPAGICIGLDCRHYRSGGGLVGARRYSCDAFAAGYDLTRKRPSTSCDRCADGDTDPCRRRTLPARRRSLGLVDTAAIYQRGNCVCYRRSLAYDGGDWLFVPAHTLNWFATSLFPPSILLFYWWSAKGFLGSNRFGPAASPAPRWLFRTDTSTPARAAQTA